MFSIGMRRPGYAAESWEILPVAKPEWGDKHLCQGCGAKFYDMGRSPITCPACEEPIAVAAPGRTRRVRKEEAKDDTPVAAANEAAAVDDEEDLLGDEVDELIEDDEEDDDAAIATLTDDEDDDDDVLAEADIDKSKIVDE